MTLPRVFVGVPAYRGMELPTAQSLLALTWALDGQKRLEGRFEFVGVNLAEGYGCSRNSEDAATAAVAAGADVLLHVDADMAFTPADVLRLLETWDLLGRDLVVGAMYPSSRGGPLVGRLVGVERVDASGTASPHGVYTARRSVAGLDGIALEATLLGFGFVAIPVPYILALVHDRGYAFEECGLGRHVDGVDSKFCAEAEARGWRLVADLRCKVKHLQRTWE